MWNALQLNVPQLTIIFIIIGKRHHIQFFLSKQDEDSSGNCPMDFVADKGITSPIAHDFYLLSRAGILPSCSLYHPEG
jgi:eukaryotic translation initiation factor 2C